MKNKTVKFQGLLIRTERPNTPHYGAIDIDKDRGVIIFDMPPGELLIGLEFLKVIYRASKKT